MPRSHTRGRLGEAYHGARNRTCREYLHDVSRGERLMPRSRLHGLFCWDIFILARDMQMALRGVFWTNGAARNVQD